MQPWHECRWLRTGDAGGSVGGYQHGEVRDWADAWLWRSQGGAQLSDTLF